MATATFPTIRFGPGTPGRYRLVDVKIAGPRAKPFCDRKLHDLWGTVPLEIRCQADDSVPDELATARERGPGGVANYHSFRHDRLTEAEHAGDVDPVMQVVTDTENANDLVACWYWYNIVLTSPTRLRMRMAAIFPVREPLSTVPVLVRWNMQIVDRFFGLQIDVDGTPVRVGAMRAFTFPRGSGRHKYAEVMEAWRLAILRRGRDSADPFTVDRISTHSGIEDLRMTWQP